MKRSYILILLAAGLAWIQSCNIINPKEPTPTYVHIDSFQFTTANYAQYGSSKHKITCIWAYYNNSPVGVFDLPATFPVITNGDSGSLTIVPGITVNGLGAYQAQYPFYKGDISTLVTTPGQIIAHAATTTYAPVTHLRFNEDFEGGNNFQRILGDTDIHLVNDPSLVIEGGGSGYIYMNSGDSTEDIYQRPFSFTSGISYIEINYRCNTTFAVGVDVFDASGNSVTSEPEYLIGVNPSSNTNKMYISLVSAASKYTAIFPGCQFRLAIKAVLPDDKTNGYVILDNIKYITD